MEQIVKYNITDAAMAEMSNLYMSLVVADLEDKEGFDAVHDARMVVKGHRVSVVKQAKVLNSDALAYQRKVNSEKKRIVALLEPIESHLQTEEDKVINEQKRIRAEEDEKERVIIQGRVDDLSKYGVTLPFFDVAAMTEAEFGDRFVKAAEDWDAEQQRLADEEAARVAEDARLKKVKEEQEAVAADQAKAQKVIDDANAKLEADKKALEDEKKAEIDRKKREVFEKKAGEDAAIQAEKDANEKAVRDAKAKAEAEEKAKAEALRQKTLMPDKEKLLALAQFLQEGITYPEMQSTETEAIVEDVAGQIHLIADAILTNIKEL